MERGTLAEELPHSAEIDELIDRNDQLAHLVLSKIVELIRTEDEQ